MLDLAGDAAGDVDLGMYGHARLAYLPVVVHEPGIHRGAAGSYLSVEFLGEGEELVESFLASNAVSSGNHYRGAFEVVFGRFDVAVDDLHHIVLGRHVLGNIGDNHLALVVLVQDLLLHDSAAHGGHLGPVLGVHDGGNDVASESGADLVEKVGVLLVGLDVLIVPDFKLGAVGGEAAGKGGTHARAEVAAYDGGSHQADLRILLLEEVHEDVRVGKGSVGEEAGGVEDEEFVHSVGEYLALDFAGDAASRCNCVQLHSETVCKLAALGQQFLGDFGNGRAFYLTIYEYVFHSSTR